MTKFAIGQTVHRLEDPTLLQGKGCYTDDLRPQGAAHAFVLRSPHAHALIRGIDTTAARQAPGVIAVLTGQDVKADDLGTMPCIVPVKNHDGTPRGETPRPVLALDRARHVGDPVALVVAETYHAARDAAELIEVDYEPLPAVADVYGAAQPGAPLVWPEIKQNIVADLHLGSKEAADAAFARAAHISKIELVQNRLVANPMEPRAAFAEYDPATDRSTLHTSSQSVALLRRTLGELPDAPPIEVIHGDLRDADLARLGTFDLVTGSPPYFPVGTGVLPPDPQRQACRFELRGGVEAYAGAMGRLLTPDGTGVLVAQTALAGRVERGAAMSGLSIRSRLDLWMREDRTEPFLTVFELRREPGECVVETLAVRAASGAITSGYASLRARVGLTTGDPVQG